MALKQRRGIVPLGNECYIVLWGNLQAVFPWDGSQETDAVLPGHANASRRSVVLLQDGTKILIGLTPAAVIDRCARAIGERERSGPEV